MQRVAILCSGGAGKSWVADVLGKRTGLPVVHLVAAVAEERWILDGNFLRDDAPDPRFPRVDTVILLDLPRSVCLWRILKRRVQEALRPRQEQPLHP